MILKNIVLITVTSLVLLSPCLAQDIDPGESSLTMYDIPPRWLVDMPTAGTLPRGHYNIGVRLYPNGGGLGYCDIGISHRFTLGLSYGGEGIISDREPQWNDRVGFSLKFRLIDELQVFPAVTIGFTDQGYGRWNDEDGASRYTFKSRGFYAVASRSFYFYKWTAGWHAGINHSLEDRDDSDDDVNVFGGFDATFNYNLAIVLEYDFGLNDDSDAEPLSGKGRGYFNASIKWLFADNLELEFVLKDLFVNRRAEPGETNTFSREVRMTYIDAF